MRRRQQGQPGLFNGSIPHACCLLAMLGPRSLDMRLLKKQSCISAAYGNCLCFDLANVCVHIDISSTLIIVCVLHWVGSTCSWD